MKFAAAEFCWTLNRPTKEMHWKKHSWKHTTFAEIEWILADVKAGRWLPPQVTVDQIGSFERARSLFRRAERGEPDAVARVDSLFPSEEDKYTAARHLFGLKDEDSGPVIPSIHQVAAQFAEIAVRSPTRKKQSSPVVGRSCSSPCRLPKVRGHTEADRRRRIMKKP